jgi:hypothetical protein
MFSVRKPVVVVTSAVCKNPHITMVFDLLSMCYVIFVYYYILTLPLVCMSFTPSTYGVVVFLCVWLLCMRSVPTPVFIMYQDGGVGGRGWGKDCVMLS